MTGDYFPQPSGYWEARKQKEPSRYKTLLRIAILSIVIGVAIGIVMH